MTAVLGAVIDALREREALQAWVVESVKIGDAVVLVELAAAEPRGRDKQRVAGLAHRPPGEPSAAMTDRSDPTELLRPLAQRGALPGSGARPEPRADSGSVLDRAVALATLNALSAPDVDWQTGDPMAGLGPDISTIVTVGLFRPAFRKFADVEVRVIEREEVDTAVVSTPEGVTVESFSPAETRTAMEGAEVVFVTGSALVYGGIEQYVGAAPDEAQVVLIGATASMLPEPLYATGIDVVAGAVVEDIDRVRSAVSAGACGTDLHDNGVRKSFVSRTRSSQNQLSLGDTQ
jgi:uncharacterized protein (DUF4213/DUF364 family)